MQNKGNKLPDFLIVGVQKAGTTWLQLLLSSHPNIYMADQELHYFDKNRNFDKGEAWYESQFEKANQGQLVGEKTPDYFWTNCDIATSKNICQNKAHRISTALPEAKLIVILREPVSRFLSAWNHNVRRGRLRSDISLDALLKEESYYVQRMLKVGCYATQLKEFRRYYASNQLLVIFQDEVKSDPDNVIRKVCDFLNVDVALFNGSVNNRDKVNSFESTVFGTRILKYLPPILQEVWLRFDKMILTKSGLKTVKYPELTETERVYLTEYYRSEMEELNALIPLPQGWL